MILRRLSWGARDWRCVAFATLALAGCSSPICDGPAPDASGARLAAGVVFSCFIRDSGQVVCWGLNIDGQLGDGSRMIRDTPNPVHGLDDAVGVAAGKYHACARRSSGDVVCWGQLHDGRGVQLTPVPIPALFQAVELTAAYGTCARCGNGTIGCFGFNLWGEIGDGTYEKRPTPVRVEKINDAVQVAMGTDSVHACARHAGGAVSCWGWNDYGQLGDSTYTHRPVPGLVPGLEQIVDVSVGGFNSCAVQASGSVWCWGSNVLGILGDGSTDFWRATPGPVAGIGDAVDVSVGSAHVCALRRGGKVSCWGSNAWGEIGDGHYTGMGADRRRPKPVEVVGLEDAVEVAAGTTHTCAVRKTGQVVCWGGNLWGERGDGSAKTVLPMPAPVVGLP